VVIERALCPVLVGRDVELGVLDDALRKARRADGLAILVSGDAGIGKSRLAHEMERRAQDERIRALWGGCSPANVAVPYLPFVEAIGSYMASADLEWLRGRLGRSRLDLAPLFPQLDPEQEALATGNAAERKLRLFEAVVTLLQIAASTRGLVLVLEDLHWADASTSELLGYVTRRLRGTRVIVLGTCRGEELVPSHPVSLLAREWRNLYGSAVIELGPLSKDAVGEMVRTILPGQPIPEALQELLNSRSEGNPFVLEELLRDSLDRGFVYRGTKRQWEGITNFSLPRTVRDTLLARLDRLPRKYVEVAKNAAVLGSSFDYWTLVSASDLNQETVERALQVCVEHQLMEEDRSAPVKYRFRHALTHEAIYESISAPTRQRMHLRVAQALRAAPRAQAANLAYHLLAAGSWQEAVPICLIAAEDAERRLGYREAIELYVRALAHIQDQLTRGQTLCKLGRAFVYADDPGRAWPYLKEGIPLLEQAGLTREAAVYRFWLGRCYWERYRPDLARIEYERVRTMLEPEGASEVLALACALLGALEFFQLRFSNALSLARHAVEVAHAANAAVPAVWGTFYIGAAQAGLGDLGEGLNNLARAYEDAVLGGFIWLAVNAAFHSSIVLSTTLRAREANEWVRRLQQLPPTAYRDRLGTFGESVRLYELGDLTQFFPVIDKALELGMEADATVWIIRCKIFKAMGLAARGSFDEAVAVMPEEDDIHERLELNWVLAFKIRMFLERGDLSRAANEARRVLIEEWQPSHALLRLFDIAVEALAAAGDVEGARQLSARAQEGTSSDHPYLLRMAASVALAAGELPKAERLLRDSVDSLNLAGHELDEARTRRLLARVLAARGNRSSASTELRHVIAYAVQSGASFEGDLAKGLLKEFGLEVDDYARVPRDAGSAIPSPDRTGAASEKHRGAPLSPREREVAVLIAQGLTNKQIARRLEIAERTAENHVEHILNRLGFQSRAQVAAWAAQERLM
jgi:DNA-binding NarL/FixJ family response regulator